jgi:hypothetical protein
MGMDSEKLSKRAKQPGHDQTFRRAERDFIKALKLIFKGPEWQVVDHPRDLSKMIAGRYGIVPEASLKNLDTGKIMYFEVKKQGIAGNADERAAKHHTVAFYKALAKATGMPFHAFSTIMCESLSIEDRYVMKHPFYFEPGRYFCWVGYDLDILNTYLDKEVRPLLEK